MAAMDVRVVISNKNKENYIIAGYIYEQNKKNDDKLYCRCTRVRQNGCKSTVILTRDGDNVIVKRNPTPHGGHDIPTREIIRKKVNSTMKTDIANNPDRSVTEVYNNNITPLMEELKDYYEDYEIACNVPSFVGTRSNIYRKRAENRPTLPRHRRDLILDGEWIKTQDGGHFLFDDGDFPSLYVSKPAPDWNGTAVINGKFEEIGLKTYLGKYLVFFFYPLDFTFVCPTEIIAFSDRIKEFQAVNTAVVACSVDSQFTHLAWINMPRSKGGLGPLNIPLLADLTHQISKTYGVYLQNLGHSLRGLFIIDSKGILRQITMNDLPVGRSVDETLRLVQAFQYTDSHGEVCPAGWKPGADTIIPDPKDKLKYFEKANKPS